MHWGDIYANTIRRETKIDFFLKKEQQTFAKWSHTKLAELI